MMCLMEWSPLPAWLTVLVIVVMTIYLYLVWPFYFGKHLTIPGPRPQVILGTLKEENKKGYVKSCIENLERYGKVNLSFLGRTPVICVSDPDIIREILVKDFNNFPNKPLVAAVEKWKMNAITMLEDDHWKYVRSVLSPSFSSGKLRQMAPIILNCVERLMESFRHAAEVGESIEVSKIFTAFSMETILATAFGVQSDSLSDPNHQFLQHSRRVFDGIFNVKPGVIFTVLFPILRPVLRPFKVCTLEFDPDGFFFQNLMPIIHERKKSVATAKPDLLQAMVNASVDDIRTQKMEDGPEVNSEFLNRMSENRGNRGLTDEEIMAQCLTFLLGGNETTTTALTYLSYTLALYPDIQVRLIREIDEELQGEEPTYNTQKLQYLDMCCSECLRMFPPNLIIPRRSKADRTYQGYTFPAGVPVNVSVYAVHHNPEYWPNPEKFVPERFSPENRVNIRPYTYIPFSGGQRNCIGIRFAQMEIKMTIVALLQKYRLEIAPEMTVPLCPKGGYNFIGTQPTILKVFKR